MKDPQTGATRQPNPVLIFDGGTQLPVQFRDTMSVYAAEPFSLEGLLTLHTSGSHQYDETQLQNIITRVDPINDQLAESAVSRNYDFVIVCARNPTCSSTGSQ